MKKRNERTIGRLFRKVVTIIIGKSNLFLLSSSKVSSYL